jgi:CheY-like chemotaxis protein
MPDMDGGEVAALMQKDEALVGVPIVFLTALVEATRQCRLERRSGCRPKL